MRRFGKVFAISTSTIDWVARRWVIRVLECHQDSGLTQRLAHIWAVEALIDELKTQVETRLEDIRGACLTFLLRLAKLIVLSLGIVAVTLLPPEIHTSSKLHDPPF